MSKEMIEIGTQYSDRQGRVCTVTDIWNTFNAVGELVQTRYVATHEFCGQTITERDILAVTIQRRLAVCSLPKNMRAVSTSKSHKAYYSSPTSNVLLPNR